MCAMTAKVSDESLMCDNCRGEFTVGNETYSVEPVDETLTGRHRVHRQSDSVSPAYVLGMQSHSIKFYVEQKSDILQQLS